VYLNNAEFGEPTDADPSDDFLVRRAQYTTSYNSRLGIPNWVAYDLNATNIQPGQDRCNCFTFDPQLPASFLRYTTADYTGAGAFAGYGIDRGHLARSFDRTGGTLDNATTFYFDNIVPQASDLNQGPWAVLENYLGDLATSQNKEVYIYAGPAGSKGTVKNEGKITIPQYTWKVALVLNRGQKVADVRDYRDVDVVSVVMPNEPGIRSVDWTTAYRVTVDSIERLTGYRFLSALAAKTARALKSGTKPPLAALDGPYTGAEGSAIAMSAAASIDPNGTIAAYAWRFGDGSSASGAAVTHAYTRPGTYPVQVVVTDNDALADTIATIVQVTNVAPVIGGISAPTTPQRIGVVVPMTASFTDVGTGDVHTATFAWGDGTSSSATITEAAGRGTASADHVYRTAGFYPVVVTVSDDAGLTATATSTTLIVVDPAVSLRADGWIATGESCPTGAHCGAGTARAQFDIELDYGRRGDRPTGGFKVTLHNADLEFEGRIADWLVATDTMATAVGHGRVRGRDGFAFLVSAIDGTTGEAHARSDSRDRIRLKIWNEATGGVLFDSQAGEPDRATPTTLLGGGSVRVRRRDGREVSGAR
jgi:DNA/RNA endonuclease G (NUC1)